MSWGDETTTLRRGTLVANLIAGSLFIAMGLISAGIIVTAIYPGTKPALIVALLILLPLWLVVSMFQIAARWLRRRARLRRMQALRGGDV